MPSDLAAAGRLVIVRDSAGLGLPFSKGLMATSILATGAETDQAYAIAAEIQRELTGRAASDIDAHELAMLAARTIEARAGAEFAARYQTSTARPTTRRCPDTASASGTANAGLLRLIHPRSARSRSAAGTTASREDRTG